MTAVAIDALLLRFTWVSQALTSEERSIRFAKAKKGIGGAAGNAVYRFRQPPAA
jgi:hypothetical protein